jgi:hypothetical protein
MSEESPASTANEGNSSAPSRKTLALDGDGRERPRFLLAFPDDPDLRVLVSAFERGDFDLIRRRAPELAETSQSQDVKAATRELLRRTQPDPVVQVLLLLAIGLFVFLVVWAYVGH